ncbi:hypothetical protein C8Q79DRAFT_356714 [Trametes meyenii]|nr:hypothetical protein C8Q79DRAFT_356714 [Trametes meyenii]
MACTTLSLPPFLFISVYFTFVRTLTPPQCSLSHLSRHLSPCLSFVYSSPALSSFSAHDTPHPTLAFTFTASHQYLSRTLLSFPTADCGCLRISF